MEKVQIPVKKKRVRRVVSRRRPGQSGKNTPSSVPSGSLGTRPRDGGSSMDPMLEIFLKNQMEMERERERRYLDLIEGKNRPGTGGGGGAGTPQGSGNGKKDGEATTIAYGKAQLRVESQKAQIILVIIISTVIGILILVGGLVILSRYFGLF